MVSQIKIDCLLMSLLNVDSARFRQSSNTNEYPNCNADRAEAARSVENQIRNKNRNFLDRYIYASDS